MCLYIQRLALRTWFAPVILAGDTRASINLKDTMAMLRMDTGIHVVTVSWPRLKCSAFWVGYQTTRESGRLLLDSPWTPWVSLAREESGSFFLPRPLGGSKSRSILGFYHLRYRSIRVQNWGIYFLDPPGGLGKAQYYLPQYTS